MNFNFTKANKFRNKIVTIDNIVFDSQKEADVYQELKTCKAAGEITSFEMQKRYELIPAQYAEIPVNGKLKKRCIERAISYLADFVLYYPDGEVVVLDPKGNKTDVYRIKKKLMMMVWKIRIKEV
jgi:hypothetical protein